MDNEIDNFKKNDKKTGKNGITQFESKTELDTNCDSSGKRALNDEKSSMSIKKQKIVHENDAKTHTPKTFEDCQQIIKAVLKGTDSEEKNEAGTSGNAIRIRKFDVNRIKSKTLKEFFSECLSDKIDAKIIEDEIKPRIGDVFANFKKTNDHFRKSKDFKQQMYSYTASIREQPNHVLQYFGLIEELFALKALQDPQDVEIDRLGNIIDDLAAKIKSLGETEVDFDEDHNSVYMQEDFYTKKLCEAYKLWCKKTGESYYRNRTMFQKLNYNNSKYPEFNKAINEMYRKKCRFPNFDLIDTVIRECAEKEKISIAEHELKHEIQTVFRDVGKICQKRRIHETNDSLGMFLGANVDPALGDSSLDAKLKEQTKIGQQKIDEVFDFYAKKQLERAKSNENGDSDEDDNDDDEDEDDEDDDDDDDDDDEEGDEDKGEDSESVDDINIDNELNNENEIEDEILVDNVDNDGNNSPNSWLGDADDNSTAEKNNELDLNEFKRMCDSILAIDNDVGTVETAKKSNDSNQEEILVLSD